MTERKQCWECLKRRLVCDLTRPRCNKCFARGVSCPGYDHKPLKWIAPGQTRSKRRGVRKDKSTGDQRRPQEEEEESASERQLVVSPSIDLSSEITSLLDAIQYCKDAHGNRSCTCRQRTYLPRHAGYGPDRLTQPLLHVSLRSRRSPRAHQGSTHLHCPRPSHSPEQ